MNLNQVTEPDFRLARIVRWIALIPAMYGTAFMTGLIFIPMGRPGKVVAILLSALAGVVMAPRHRIWVTVFAFFYGNYLYATNINYIYHENYTELFTGYCAALVRQAKLFSIPTVLTLFAAVMMDRESKEIKRIRAQSNENPSD